MNSRPEQAQSEYKQFYFYPGLDNPNLFEIKGGWANFY